MLTHTHHTCSHTTHHTCSHTHTHTTHAHTHTHTPHMLTHTLPLVPSLYFILHLTFLSFPFFHHPLLISLFLSLPDSYFRSHTPSLSSLSHVATSTIQPFASPFRPPKVSLS